MALKTGSIKHCKECGRDLPCTDEFFYRRNSDRYKQGFVYHYRCKECTRKQVRTHQKETGIISTQKVREWIAKNPDKHFRQQLRKKSELHGYTITKEEYEALFAKQGGCCALCGMDSKQNKKRLAIDHCHSAKNIRGLLCSKCNQGLGLFNDSPELLRKAAVYVEANKR